MYTERLGPNGFDVEGRNRLIMQAVAESRLDQLPANAVANDNALLAAA